MWHRLPHAQKRAPKGVRYERGGDVRRRGAVSIPAGRATLGADRSAVLFGWDNEFGEQEVDVDGFEIDVDSVTNGEYLEFIDAGGYRTRALWSELGWQWREEERVRRTRERRPGLMG